MLRCQRPGEAISAPPDTDRRAPVTFLESFWLVLEIFFVFAYIVVMFQIVGDLFRDTTLGGGVKAVWVFFLIALPPFTALVYLIVRGKSMTERQVQAVAAAQEGTKSYIREVAGTSPAQEIAAAKALLDAGTISAAEFAALKTKALATA